MSVNTHQRSYNSWDARIHHAPDPVKVAKLVETHGVEAANERWAWLDARTIGYLAQRGRRMLAA